MCPSCTTNRAPENLPLVVLFGLSGWKGPHWCWYQGWVLVRDLSRKRERKMWVEGLVELDFLWLLLRGWIPGYLITCSHCFSWLGCSHGCLQGYFLGIQGLNKHYTLFLKNSFVWWVSPLLLRLFHETNEDLFWDHYPSLCVHFQFCLLVLGKKKRRRKKSHLDQVVKRSCLPRTQVIQDHVSYQAPSMFFICMA